MDAAHILEQIRHLRVLVVGDICLDRWCYYDPASADISRETGIPRIAVVRSELTPGAGGTIANNLVALGVGAVSVLGVVGDDGFGSELRRALSSRGISTDLLRIVPDLCTFTYTKLINMNTGVEDLPRVDYVNTEPLQPSVEREIVGLLERYVQDFDVIMVSDQAETHQGGIVTPPVRDCLIALAERHNDKVFWVDSRVRAERFRSIILKPNASEADAACRRLFGEPDHRRLFEDCQLRMLVVTEGSRGATVHDRQGSRFVPGRSVEAVDICGAGDSFSAGAACALAVTNSAVDAAAFGNTVASITVTKKGTGTASPEEVLAALRT